MHQMNVLFLCTGNSARSIMAEALLNDMGYPRFQAYSAGSHPAGAVNPFARALLERYDIWADHYSSKSWSLFAEPGSPEMDFIITVCDNAAGEVCPVWPGRPASAHWGFEDPAAFEGADWEKATRFLRIFSQIRAKISLLIDIPFQSLGEEQIAARLKAIGEIDPETLTEVP